LLAFSVAIFRGIWVDNPISTVLLRAWCSLMIFLIIGAFLGYIATIAMEEHYKDQTQRILEEMNRQETEQAKAAQVESQQPVQ